MAYSVESYLKVLDQGFTSTFKEAKNQVEDLGDSSERTSGILGSMGGALKGFAGLVGGATVAVGGLAISLGKSVIDSYGENGINYSLRVWTKTDDYWDVYYLINQNVREIFQAQNIKMAYPHMHIYMEQ